MLVKLFFLLTSWFPLAFHLPRLSMRLRARGEEPEMSRINSILTGLEPKTFKVLLSGEERMFTTPFSSFTTAAPKLPHMLCTRRTSYW